MRWRHLHLRGAVHLISRLRRQLPLIGEALGCADPKPPLPGEVARRNAETERLCRKETTSQSASQTAHLGGEPLGMRPIFAEKAVRALVKGERM